MERAALGVGALWGSLEGPSAPCSTDESYLNPGVSNAHFSRVEMGKLWQSPFSEGSSSIPFLHSTETLNMYREDVWFLSLSF